MAEKTMKEKKDMDAPEIPNLYDWESNSGILGSPEGKPFLNKREVWNNLRYADDTTLMSENEEELKSLLMKLREEREKVGLKLNFQKTKIMASGPITSWEIDGKTVEAVSDFIFWGSKITADGDCSHEIKRHLLLERKVMNNFDSILKSRDITLSTKVCLVKAMVFQWSCMDVRLGLWRKLSAKELMLLNCGVGEDSWESLGLQGDPTSHPKGDQSCLCSLEGLMLKLKLQYFGHFMWRVEKTHWKRPWCWEGLGAGGKGDDRGWDGWMASPTRWAWV